MQDTHSEVKITWIMLILILPVVGTLSYLFFNGQLSQKKVKHQQRHMAAQLKHGMLTGVQPDIQLALHGDFAKRQSCYLEQVANAPSHTNTQATYFKLGDHVLETLLEELSKAEKSIFLEFFIIGEGQAWSEIEYILTQKAREGVDVRVIYDYFGSLFTVPVHFARRLNDKNIQCYAFNPYTHFFSASYNNRDHRKICVIDGEVGLTGGINLDYRSLMLHYECGVWLYESPVIGDMKRDFLETQAKCIEITQAGLETRKKTIAETQKNTQGQETEGGVRYSISDETDSEENQLSQEQAEYFRERHIVVPSSSQLKKTDNLNPTSAPDIRYSLRDSTESDKEAATLRKENARLKEQVEELKGQTKRTTQVTTDKKAVIKEARALNKAFEGTVPVDDELYQSYADLRKELRSTTLQLTKEESADFPAVKLLTPDQA